MCKKRAIIRLKGTRTEVSTFCQTIQGQRKNYSILNENTVFLQAMKLLAFAKKWVQHKWRIESRSGSKGDHVYLVSFAGSVPVRHI